MHLSLIADDDETIDRPVLDNEQYATCISTAFTHKLQEKIYNKMHSTQTLEG